MALACARVNARTKYHSLRPLTFKTIAHMTHLPAAAEILELTAEELAAQAHLTYVSDDQPGIERQPWGRGFTYRDDNGNCLKDGDIRRRCQELMIPPAWQNVWICADSKGHIQATGRDEKGRKQYIYHAQWEEISQQTKFDRLIPFAECLPALRTQVNKDLRHHKLSHQKVTALVISLLEESLIRVGNDAYAAQNQSYGLTTMQSDHLDVNSTTIHFDFIGKSGKHQEIDVHNRRLARLIKRCQELPGQELFQYENGSNTYTPITSTDVNHYLLTHMGHHFTAKDFRTWGATVLAAQEFIEQGQAETEPAGAKHVVAVVKAVAAALGNTPAVCRRYYIHPLLIESYLSGDLLPALATTKTAVSGLSRLETAVLNFLRQNFEA